MQNRESLSDLLSTAISKAIVASKIIDDIGGKHAKDANNEENRFIFTLTDASKALQDIKCSIGNETKPPIHERNNTPGPVASLMTNKMYQQGQLQTQKPRAKPGYTQPGTGPKKTYRCVVCGSRGNWTGCKECSESSDHDTGKENHDYHQKRGCEKTPGSFRFERQKEAQERQAIRQWRRKQLQKKRPHYTTP